MALMFETDNQPLHQNISLPGYCVAISVTDPLINTLFAPRLPPLHVTNQPSISWVACLVLHYLEVLTIQNSNNQSLMEL
jgi:hypothetical protein